MKSRLEKYKDIDKDIKKETKTKKKRRTKNVLKKSLIIFIIIFCLCITYARVVEPNMLFTNEYKIESLNISTDFHGLKIVHISDLHYGSTIFKNQLDKIEKQINRLKPDIIVFTGDLIEKKYIKKITDKDINNLTNFLNNIDSNLGKYAILGNHDYKNKNINNLYFDTNFLLLNNNYDIIYGKNGSTIGIYGFDDTLEGSPNTELLISDEYKKTNYKIVLVHEPDYIDNFINLLDIDLILSGHSHNCQVRLPFIKPFWLPIGAKTYYEPYYKINNTKIYISTGIGESFLNLRFFSPPSLNYYRLNKK